LLFNVPSANSSSVSATSRALQSAGARCPAKQLAELERLMEGITTARRLLKRKMKNCHCDTLDECGKGLFRSAL
jgi:hypothetical protein